MTKTWDDIIEYEDLKKRVTAYVTECQKAYLPTVRQLARHFKMKQADMLQLVEDTDELMYNIGVQVQGVGVHEYRSSGDYTVEIA